MNALKYSILLITACIITSCVQQSQPKHITVKVDMNGVENTTKVGIRGSNPLSWNNTTFLSDENNDGIYIGVFEIYSANRNVEFKFVNNEDEFELQDQNNRVLTFEYKPETIIYNAAFDNLNDVEIVKE